MIRSKVRVLVPAFAVSGALLAALVGLSGCRSEATPAGQAPAPQVSVASALERNVTEWDEFTGRLEAVESVDHCAFAGKLAEGGIDLVEQFLALLELIDGKKTTSKNPHVTIPPELVVRRSCGALKQW